MNQQQLRWASLKVGIVVLIGLVVFVFIVTVVGTEQNIFSSNYSLRLYMPNVQGLVNGAMVTLGGLKIGYVRGMQFTSRNGTNGVDVTIDILTKYRETITVSSMAQIKTIGLLGDKYIDIGIGAKGEQVLAENSYIPLRESFDLEAAGPQLKTALADFSELMSSTKRIVASIEKGEGTAGKLIKQPAVANEMEHFLHSLNNVLGALEARQGALGQLVYNGTLSQNISEVSSNLRSVTDQLRKGQGTMGKLLMDEKLYTNLASLTSRADTIMARASNDSSNVSKLIGDPKFYSQIITLVNDLNLLLVDLREHPDRYIKVSVF